MISRRVLISVAIGWDCHRQVELAMLRVAALRSAPVREDLHMAADVLDAGDPGQ